MLQASFVMLLAVGFGDASVADEAIASAARAVQRAGSIAGRRVLAQHGFHPFGLGRFDDRAEAEAMGMTHCAPSGAGLYCARIVARVVDASPVHLALAAAPGFRLAHVDAVDGAGRGRRLALDGAGMVDLPSGLGQRWTIGLSVRGELGPETGLLLRHGGGAPTPEACAKPENLSALVATINGQRRRQGAEPLRFTTAPTGYARQRSAELAKAFGHSPIGLPATLARHHLRLKHAAEVVAEDPSLAAICRGWMLSPAHRRALLDPRRDVIAFVQRGERLAALLWRSL